jgi:hypothetical protein
MLFERCLADVRYSAAWLLRSPAFSLVAIASLAIGIGVNTALFSLVDALLLRPLPIERADQIVDVNTRRAGDDAYETSSYPDRCLSGDKREANRGDREQCADPSPG